MAATTTTTAAQSRPAHVSSNGSISRSTTTSNKIQIKTGRTIVCLLVLVCLILSNPANHTSTITDSKWWRNVHYNNHQSSSSSSSSLLLAKEVNTNYGIFVLTKNHSKRQIVLSGLFSSTQLCTYHYPGGRRAGTLDSSNHNNNNPLIIITELSSSICLHIADHYCHGKSFMEWNNLSDLPYTMCRFVSLLLLSSKLVSFCCCCSYNTFNNNENNSLLHFASSFLLHHDGSSSLLDFVGDMIRWNMFGYPALQSMYNLISTYTYNRDSIRWNFCLGCIILIIILGNLANKLGGLMVVRNNNNNNNNNNIVTGMDGVIATSLGYTVATSRYYNRTTTMLFWGGGPLISYTHYMLLHCSHLLLWQKQRVGNVVTIIIGAALGNTFAQLHRQWLIDSLWASARHGWNQFLQGLTIMH